MARCAVALAATAALMLTGCTSTTSGKGTLVTKGTGGGTGSSGPTGNASTSGGPTAAGRCDTYAAPDPNRPDMNLQFTFAADHSSVVGHEVIVFRPDRPITELIFRLTANTRPTVAQGNNIVITSATADHGGTSHRFTRAAAAARTQGGLLHIPLLGSVAAGSAVTATIDFRVTLGAGSFDRFGRSGGFAWLGSGEPLLAWERGFGWHTEDMAQFPAESATSEAMRVDLTVTAPAADTVIMSGDPADPPRGGSTRTWHSTIAAARDVSVAAGPFVVSDTTVDGVRLRLGAPTASARELLVPEFQRAMRELSRRFGPFPFPSLSVARLPGAGGGIEYPSAIQMIDDSSLVAVHETAHQWFYAMVGDSQALHPWLDEAFATYAEELVNNDEPRDNALNSPLPVDASTESYRNDIAGYYFTTYNKGAEALLAARAAAGASAWDSALRCYVAANAWRIANPPDLAAAIAGLPAAIDVLRRAGALR